MVDVSFGIVGCGAISDKHGQAFAQIPGARLVAVSDIDERRAQAFAAKHGSGIEAVSIFVDYRRMLDDSRVDAVIVATPSGLHARIGLDALDAGKHVLVEKPLALTSEDAQTLIERARITGKCLGTVHPNRYYPTSRMIHAAISDGRFGRLSHGVATVRWNRKAAYYEEAPWRKTRAMDGGIIFNQAWHAADLLLWFMGSAVVDVQSMQATRFHDVETEDVALAIMRLESGALGLIEASTNVYPRNLEHTVSVFGETGTMVQGGGSRVDALRVWRVADDDEKEYLREWGEDSPIRHSGSWAHARVLEEFASRVCAQIPGAVSSAVYEAASLVGIIERFCQAAPCSSTDV